jgi:hypothetical protein
LSRTSLIPDNLDELISQADAARMRAVSIQAIGDLIKRGKLRGYKVAGRTLLRRSEVEAFVPQPLGRPPKHQIDAKDKEKKAPNKKKKPPMNGI